jgi:hypothetical protein
MTPFKHSLCNDVLRAPEESKNCADLHILRQDGYVSSFWKPDDNELAALNSGGSLIMQVCGYTHPPLGIGVMAPEPGHERLSTNLSSYHSLIKRTLAALVKACPESKEATALSNEFLDMTNC